MSAASDLRDRCRRLGWAAGLPGLVLILGFSAAWTAPRIEAHLAGEAEAVVRDTALPGAEPWLRVRVRGRDLAAAGEAPDPAARDAAHARLAGIPGLRHLTGPVGVVEPVSPFVWVAIRNPDGIVLTGFRPAEIGAGALAERLRPALEPGTPLRDETHAALGSPPDFPGAAAYALARLRALTPGGRVSLEGTRLSVAGEAASIADAESLRVALAEPPAGYTLGRVEIVPASTPDFRFVVARRPGGDIALSGHVVSETARGAIRAQAASASETGQVEDRMRTARGLAAGIDPAAMAQFALRLAGLMQEGSVTVADAAVSLSGIALDGEAAPEIEALLREALPPGLRRGEVALTTRPLSPYRVALRRDAEGVTLSGHLPDTGTRESLLAALRPRLFRERLIDRTRLGEGAPADLRRALEAAAGPLLLLARGEVRIADRAVMLTGESLYAQSGRRIRSDLPAAMPAGWTATVAVTTPGETQVRTPDDCAEALAPALTDPGPAFAPGSATLRPDFYPRLDGIAALAGACPSLRLTVTGHADPAGAAPAPKPAVEAAVESTASLDAAMDAAKAPAKDAAKSALKTTSDPAKPVAAKPVAAKPAAGRAETKGDAKPAEPEPDLAQQRALAVVTYLLQAGLRPDQVAAAPTGTPPRPAARGIGLALRP